jgi:hypothetical protein
MSADDVLRLLASVDMAKLEVHAKFLQQYGPRTMLLAIAVGISAS